MSDSFPKLNTPPIVEAVLDIDCDMPPAFDLAKLTNEAHQKFDSEYPEFQQQNILQHKIESHTGEPPTFSASQGLQALQFLQKDKKQLVQIRAKGFSFNRLAPYTTLDDYLPEMKRTWKLFVEIAEPVEVQAIKLRYINRIVLSNLENSVDLDDYFKTGPKIPDEGNLTIRGFLTQYIVSENDTKNFAAVVLATQPGENAELSFIFDITATRNEKMKIEDWQKIAAVIESLRQLKNRIFHNTLTQRCLELYQNSPS
jgi:uncharacterized protein (TIGR04255 family)